MKAKRVTAGAEWNVGGAVRCVLAYLRRTFFFFKGKVIFKWVSKKLGKKAFQKAINIIWGYMFPSVPTM